VVFSYKILAEDSQIITRKITQDPRIIKENNKIHHVGGYNFPSMMDCNNWGECTISANGKYTYIDRPTLPVTNHIYIHEK
jgi:hypothetical protein